MCPKAQPTQVIVHRIELQQTERDTLEAALAGRFVTNAVSATGQVFTGLGNLLSPFRDVFTAIGALWLADKTLDQIKETWDASIEAGQSWIANRYGAGDYEEICAFLNAQYSQGGWDQLLEGDPMQMEGAEFQSAVWRTGAYYTNAGYYYPQNGGLSGPFASNPRAGTMPQWLIDRFDIFINGFASTPRPQWESSNPATLWESFMPYSEYEQYVVHSVHPD